MVNELMSGALVGLWLLLVALRWHVLPRAQQLGRYTPAPRILRRQWLRLASLVGGSARFGYRLFLRRKVGDACCDASRSLSNAA
jgi:hypothetical protein